MRHVLVTGANRGIGLELTRQLLARGDRVLATCRKPAQASALNKLAFAHPGHLHILPLDVSKPASIAELAREVPLITDALDAVINNAGVLPEGERFGELDARVLESTFATNTVGPLLVTQALLPFLRKGQSPRVMSISSILGSIGAREGFYTPSYCISKAALNMGTRLMSFELAKLGVIAFVVHPGWVKTEMGGAGAQVEVADAAAGLLRVLDGATAASIEAMQTYDGGTLPW